MGLGMQCYLGFSVRNTTAFSDHLESRTAALDRDYRAAHAQALESFNHLHAAVDSALSGDGEEVSARLGCGLLGLASCNDHLSAIGEALVRTRSELFERVEVDAGDPLIARERYFPLMDYDGLYRELAAHGGALPQRVFWDELVSRLRDGGTRAGLRLLDRHLRELQSDLRTFIAEVESLRGLPLPDLARALHGHSFGIAALLMGFIRLLATCTFFGVICERASLAFEAGLPDQDQTRVAS
jgi:hypothetical protein